LALRDRGLARRVVGVGRSRSSLRAAQRVGALDEATTELARGVSEAELVVVCTPVESIVPQVVELARWCRGPTLVTDAGSTKGHIVAGLDGCLPPAVRFVGSHPLAGSEKRGPESASTALFVGRVVVVTPTEQTRPVDLQRISTFWRSLGAKVVRMTADEHDRAVAATSHVPHWVASALAAAVPKKHFPLAAGGLLDTTRVAAGDPELWTQIFMANRTHLLEALGEFDAVAARLRQALEAGERNELTRLLALGKKNRDALGS